MPRGGATSALKVYRCFNFGGGLDVKTSALTLAHSRAQKWLTRADNCTYATAGAVSKRLDVATANTTTLGAAVAITGGFYFRKLDGTDYNVCGTNDGRLVKLNTDGSTTDLATGLTTGRRWSFDVFNDVLICCNGADAPLAYDGASVATLGGSPPSTGQVVCAHSNRVFMFAPDSQRLYWSALNNQADWAGSGSGNVYIRGAGVDSGQALTGMISARAGGPAQAAELILQTPKAFYRLQGTAPTTYALTDIKPATATAGGTSFQSLLFAANDVYTTYAGGIHSLRYVQQFGDLQEDALSAPIDPYFQTGTGYTLSLQNAHLAVGAYDRQTSRLYFAFDSDGDAQNDKMLVYDMHTKGWSVWPSQSCASLWLVRNASTGVEELHMGGYDGFVRVLNRSASTNAIDGHARHISALGAAGVEKSPRHLFLYMKEDGNWSVTVDTKFDFGGSGGQSYSVSLLGNAHTLGVDWVLGTDPLGAADTLVKRVNLSGTGEFLEIGVRNQNAGQPFTWLGYEVFWRPRRAIRKEVA